MNWGDVGGWVAAAIALIGAVFVYGKFAQQLTSHDRDIQHLWGAKSNHDEKFTEHGERITRCESALRIKP